MSTATPSTPGAMPSSHRRTTGWPTFVAIYLLIVGTLNVIWGIAALDNKSYFVSGGLVWSQLNTWGWISIILGAIQIGGSALVFSRHVMGAVIAGLLAFLGILLNFLSIGAYPVWSAVMLVIDGMIIWGVTVHGEDFVD